MMQETLRRNELLKLDADLRKQLKQVVKDTTKTAVAEQMGISRSTLDRLLKGKGNFESIEKVEQFLKAA